METEWKVMLMRKLMGPLLAVYLGRILINAIPGPNNRNRTPGKTTGIGVIKCGVTKETMVDYEYF